MLTSYSNWLKKRNKVKTNTFVNPLDTDYNTTNTQEGKINYKQDIRNRQDKTSAEIDDKTRPVLK